VVECRQSNNTTTTAQEGNEMERTITIKELQESKSNTWSVKDNSVRGYTTKCTDEVKQGDKVVIENYFTLVI
jgi:hypothetical protein